MLSVMMFKINEIMMIKISIDANRGERGGFEGLPRNPPLLAWCHIGDNDDDIDDNANNDGEWWRWL